MKTFKQLLEELSACSDAIEWAGKKEINNVVKQCPRGDWLLWLGQRLNLPLNKMTLAKARCAKTVINLMTDGRSVNAVNVAERFGLDEATLEELNSAASASYAAAAASASAYASYAASAASYASARTKNEKQTAKICREILGELIIEAVNKKLLEG